MEIMKLRVADICESAMNPRKTFDKDAISELAKNIAEQGLLQPITVRTPHAEGFDTFEKLDKDGTAHEFKYEVVCGARRFRAINHLGWEEIPAIVRDMTDAEAFDLYGTVIK
jgi:ParB family chromosome partitioning protein